MLAGFTSCSEDDDFDPGTGQEPTLTFTPATMGFKAAGRTKRMQITSNTTWSITGAPARITGAVASPNILETIVTAAE